ncbi:hypothetical protein [Nostoc sp. CHAB 5715]|uniref:hypothetical protein n=1 Tax=Nostoc sp. CHAB 5715 TaxID=2780400 RepID=UPI001E62D81F|nr:hypothetical protein [Nostoc sp. CHAB 5715]MCC5622472.1 hypothetical protein [Nostoc sp. CHAB 5715]
MSFIEFGESFIEFGELFKWVCKNIYVIANEVKQSQGLAIASFRFSTRRYRERYTRNDNVYLILHDYLHEISNVNIFIFSEDIQAVLLFAA